MNGFVSRKARFYLKMMEETLQLLLVILFLSRKVHGFGLLFWKIPNTFRYVCQHLDLIDALEKMEKIKKGKTLPRILNSSTRLQKKIVDSSEDKKPEILYHMTTKAEWEKAKAENHAYYPKTFEVDGLYTHATGVPSRLIETANHFYQDVTGDWICLQFRRSVLRSKFGIAVRDE